MSLDIPQNDFDCWDRYPKHHWVYDLSRLLDAQNIKWSPFKTLQSSHPMPNLNLINDSAGIIYVPALSGKRVFTEAYIVKGEIKLLRHIDKDTYTESTDIIGEIELRINAFVTLYFQKFTGVLSIETIKSDIYAISLKPIDNINLLHSAEIDKLIKRIYKKIDESAIIEKEIITI